MIWSSRSRLRSRGPAIEFRSSVRGSHTKSLERVMIAGSAVRIVSPISNLRYDPHSGPYKGRPIGTIRYLVVSREESRNYPLLTERDQRHPDYWLLYRLGGEDDDDGSPDRRYIPAVS